MAIIDFHTHILPGIDDGSRDAAESLSMIREELKQGVDRIIATPHFYADRMTVEEFLRRREDSAVLLAEALKTEVEADQASETQPGGLASVRAHAAAEVYFFPGMGRAEKLPELCLRGTNLILIEMPFTQWDALVLQELTDILTKQNLRIVLVHVERYPEFQRDGKFFDQVIDLGRNYPVTLQVNSGAFLKSRSRRKFCLKLLQEHENVILGSDCHNMTSRVPNLAEARQIIEKKLGRPRLELLDQTAIELLTDRG